MEGFEMTSENSQGSTAIVGVLMVSAKGGSTDKIGAIGVTFLCNRMRCGCFSV